MSPGVMPGIVEVGEGGGYSFHIAASGSFYADFHNVSCLLNRIVLWNILVEWSRSCLENQLILHGLLIVFRANGGEIKYEIDPSLGFLKTYLKD